MPDVRQSRLRQLSLSRAMLWNIVSSLALPLSATLTGPFLARALGPDGRGTLAAVLASVMLAITLSNLGLPSAALYFIAKGKDAPSVLRRTSLLVLGLAVVGVAALLLLTPVLLGNYRSEWLLYAGIALTLPLAMMIELLRSTSQAMGLYDLPLWERWIAVAVRTCGIAIFFAVGSSSIAIAGWVSWLPGIVAGIVYIHVFPAVKKRPPAQTVLFSETVKYGVKTWLGNVAGILTLRLDQVLLIFLTTPDQLGLYVVAISVAEVPLMAISAVRELLTSATVANDDVSIIASSMRTAVLLGTVVTAVAVVAVRPVIPAVFGSDFAGAVVPTQILLVGSLTLGISVVANAGLAALGRPGLVSLVQGCGVAFATVLVVVLTPMFGSVGAAVASTISYFFVALLSCWQYSRLSRTKLRDCLVPRRKDVLTLRKTFARRART